MTASATISAKLEPGETLIWAEAADAQAIVSDLAPAVAWGLIFTVFGLIAGVSALRQSRADPNTEVRRNVWVEVAVPCFIALFGGVLLYVSGTEVLSASSTSYGLTDRRVIVVRQSPIASVQSYRPGLFARMLAWEDGPRLEFDYRRPQKGSDYSARLYVRDPRAWEERIRSTFGIEPPAETPET